MNTLKVQLENCYGIGKLDADFDFTTKPVHALYASNGTMKSSFARTFSDLSESRPSSDRLYPGRLNVRTIEDESGADILPDQVFVIKPYEASYSNEAKASTLLVNQELRKQYETLQADIDKAEDDLITALATRTKTKKDIRTEVSSAFTTSNFLIALGRAKSEVDDYVDQGFDSQTYDAIFDDKILALLDTKNVKDAIADYIRRYNELLAQSTYFKKGVFSYYNAEQIADALAKNGFFDANHTVHLSGNEERTITTKEELAKLIEDEKQVILKDKALMKSFQDVEKAIHKNADVRNFEEYLSEHDEILHKLSDLPAFKQEIWIHYLNREKVLYDSVLARVELAKEGKTRIENAAKAERTKWEEIIEIFNSRFFVPFTLTAKNRVDAILGNEMLQLGFEFKDRGDSVNVPRDTLLQTLSTGEQKAFYILNVVFEIETIKDSGQDGLIIFDDIADSFDYRNKFAIIQYIDDTVRSGNCKVILLTHNFDFLRTVESRFVPRKNCRLVRKDDSGEVTLQSFEGIRDIFGKTLKDAFYKSDSSMIASIPFIRNIVEYTKDTSHQDYLRLTSLLHMKADTGTITREDLASIYNSTFGTSEAPSNPNGLVIETLWQVANQAAQSSSDLGIDTKVILAIAIRLLAEQYMIAKLTTIDKASTSSSNQTRDLADLYRTNFGEDQIEISVIDRVLLMTPENIHLNAFMYEPLIDMSDQHLRVLYEDVKTKCATP